MTRWQPPELQNGAVQDYSRRSALTGYGWAAAGVAAATLLFRLGRGELDKGQAPLLYLPVVVACAIRLGFGPALLAAAGSFVCWNYFFLPPYGTWTVADPKDWLSLTVFLMVAVATGRLAAQARSQTQEAQARAREAHALQRASEEISAEVETERILPALGRQLVSTCDAAFCAIYRSPAMPGGEPDLAAILPEAVPTDATRLSEAAPWVRQAYGQGRLIGFTPLDAAPRGAEPPPGVGVFAPLVADGQCRGVVHVGPRRDGQPFDRPQERLILALANHAAVALARQTLHDEAAQAQVLREADVLKNTLLSLVSHELRTPLAAIKASASGLLQNKSGWDSAALEEGLEAINDESDRLGGLVGKLLDLSRLEAGAWKPQWDWCDLLDVLGTVLARLPEHQGRRVRVVSPPDLPLVRADFVQIAQVMTNLLENALKYAPAGTDVTVTLRTAGNDVQVSVTDRGPGVPPDEAEAVFERFHRLDRDRRSGLPGTGLGLAICRGILDAHGGRIWERDAPGGGAVFSFTLPRAARFTVPADTDDEPASDREAAIGARAHPGR